MEAVKSVKGRRRHSEEFKAQLVMTCVQGRRTISSVAAERKVNASLVHYWISQRRSAAAKGDYSGEGRCGPRERSARLRTMASRCALMIRIEAVWLAARP